jgi:hypothetical protein
MNARFLYPKQNPWSNSYNTSISLISTKGLSILEGVFLTIISNQQTTGGSFRSRRGNLQMQVKGYSQPPYSRHFQGCLLQNAKQKFLRRARDISDAISHRYCTWLVEHWFRKDKFIQFFLLRYDCGVGLSSHGHNSSPSAAIRIHCTGAACHKLWNGQVNELVVDQTC